MRWLVPSAQISPLPCGSIVSGSTSHSFGHHFASLPKASREASATDVADHVGLARGAGMRGFRRARGVVVADGDVLGPHAELFGRDLRQHGEDALADLGDAGDDLRGAAVVDLGPGAGAIHRRGAGDPVPAGGHAASAFARHYSAASRSSARSHVESARRARQAARTPSPLEIAARVAARYRRALLPSRRLSRRLRARADRLTDFSCLLGVRRARHRASH